MQDIHTHLYWQSYDADRDAVVRRAREAGVKEMLVIGCTVDESRQAIAVAEKYEAVYASVGIHPHEINSLVESQNPKDQIEAWVTDLRKLARQEKVVAIGECGLDYYSHPARNAAHNAAGGDKTKAITDEQKVMQKEGFLAQIALAQELNLPIIVHCRPSQGTQDAYEDMFEILKDHSPASTQDSNRGESPVSHPISCILHCYMGDTEVTQKFLTLPMVYFSFTGNITYPVKKALAGTKDDLTETVKLVLLERVFAETDCPFLAPQAHRGKRNEPAFVKEVLECIAKLQGQEVSAAEQTIEANFKKVFSQT